jgi:hypothetical protein
LLTSPDRLNDIVLDLYFILLRLPLPLRESSRIVSSIRLAARRLLQGLLARDDPTSDAHGTLLHTLRSAIVVVRTWPLKWRSRRATPERPGVTKNPVLTDQVSIAVVDAAIALIGGFDAISSYLENQSISHELTQRPELFLLATACRACNPKAIQDNLTTFQSRYSADENYDGLLNLCLSTAMKHNWTPAITPLLAHCQNVNARPPRVPYLIIQAVRQHRLDIVERLLLPSSQLARSGTVYETAIRDAAFYRPQDSMAIVNILFENARDFNQARLRCNIFATACQNNDLTLAKYIMTKGPVDIYNRVQNWLESGESPLVIATKHHSIDCIKLILENKDTFSAPIRAERRRWVHEAALRQAVWDMRMDIFELLLSHDVGIDALDLYRLGAQMEGGVRAVDNARELEPSSAPDELSPDFWSTLGHHMVADAVDRLCVDNARRLLARGARPIIELTVGRRHLRRLSSDTRPSSDMIEEMNALLAEYDLGPAKTE